MCAIPVWWDHFNGVWSERSPKTNSSWNEDETINDDACAIRFLLLILALKQIFDRVRCSRHSFFCSPNLVIFYLLHVRKKQSVGGICSLSGQEPKTSAALSLPPLSQNSSLIIRTRKQLLTLLLLLLLLSTLNSNYKKKQMNPCFFPISWAISTTDLFSKTPKICSILALHYLISICSFIFLILAEFEFRFADFQTVFNRSIHEIQNILSGKCYRVIAKGNQNDRQIIS